MAQHIPIEAFKQKAMVKIGESIRKQGYFDTSMRFERIDETYNKTPEDKVYSTMRAIPKGIMFNDSWGYFEIHTKPGINNKRIVTDIYLVA